MDITSWEGYTDFENTQFIQILRWFYPLNQMDIPDWIELPLEQDHLDVDLDIPMSAPGEPYEYGGVTRLRFERVSLTKDRDEIWRSIFILCTPEVNNG